MSSIQSSSTDMSMDPVLPRGSSLGFARKFGAAFVILIICFGAASFMILLGLTRIEPTENVILIVTATMAFWS